MDPQQALLKPTEYGVETDNGFLSTESWPHKVYRKSKENPFVPIGAIATVAAFIMSSVKMRKGESRQMNYWMRARVIFQGATVGALAIGAIALGQTKAQRDARAQGENDAVLAKAARERAEFEQRLQAAEEVQRQEDEMKSKGAKWFGMFSSGKGVTGGAQARRAAEPQKLTAPTSVTSAPAGEAKVHAPATQSTVSSAPASADKVRTPVADAPDKSSWWSWLGGSAKKS